MAQHSRSLITLFTLTLFCFLTACAPRYYTETSETIPPEGIIVATPADTLEKPEGIYEEQIYEEPIYIDPVYDGSAYEKPEGQAPVYDVPIYEQPVFEAPVYEEPIYENPDFVTPIPNNNGAATGETCGGMSGLSCGDPNDACIMSMAQQCGAADGMGVCTPRPLACTQDYRPVCGCDGNNYANACSANSAGVSPAYEGECQYH